MSTTASICSDDSGPGIVFHCSRCLSAIEENAPVFRCCDASYCSAQCRRWGFAAHMLAESSPEDLRKSSSASSSSWRSSDFADSTCSSVSAEKAPGRGAGLHRGVFGWIISAGLRKLASFVEGMEPLRSASTANAWLGDGAVPPQLSTGRAVCSSQEHLWDLPVEDRGPRGLRGVSSSEDLAHLMEGLGQ